MEKCIVSLADVTVRSIPKREWQLLRANAMLEGKTLRAKLLEIIRQYNKTANK